MHYILVYNITFILFGEIYSNSIEKYKFSSRSEAEEAQEKMNDSKRRIYERLGFRYSHFEANGENEVSMMLFSQVANTAYLISYNILEIDD